MRIGVAIPCYIGHIDKLLILLDSIEQQTRLPDKVVVSCSSTTVLPSFPKYNFEFEFVCEPTKKNPSENRNIAGLRLMDTDIIYYNKYNKYQIVVASVQLHNREEQYLHLH